MDEVESKANVLQLEHQTPNYARYGDQFTFGGHFDIRETGLPHFEGNCVNSTQGEYRYMADVELMRLPLDVSKLTLDWVASTKDKLFRNLSVSERRLLHLRYAEEMSWLEIADAFASEPHVIKRYFNEIMRYLRGHAAFQKSAV
jgi:hypothetical protein